MNRNYEGRQKRAQERMDDAAQKNLSPAQKIEQLDSKFGKGVGAAKERAKLAKLIKGKDTSPADIATATIPDDMMAEIEAMNVPSQKKSKKKK